MSDLHDMIRISGEETITPDIEAQLEHKAQPEHPSNDEVADSYAADEWHDAHEYPDW